ncbi:uncharacterized protein MICPUCDRAFT_47417 [Micromonas pusilla CCMP1545]|uniref:Predicted protein n=1 Tax=Micromonas pusilla (strain CCMP1545) TaxID=564608 RepID=C1MSD5_MICPC|nr:uncharacterized protein MICPUCDRAFT_47417 [Micromonas pusilla CCMP1545]EEH57116.1 predicted protein [Micromonas pusilla CCMP1545]|eukprot:XP_003058661.1 predicted protein [Micromonas pusilla CCMP1545]
MPCCDRDGATMAFCVGCVDIICSQGPGGVGRCPKCRALVRRSNDGARGVFVGAELHGTCRMCLQSRTIVDVERNVCDACELGARHALWYECRACAATQRIPHPMWRYQPSAATFGNVTWACQRCGDYTNWRVHPDDADGVPLGDAPESWGVRERWLEDVRRTRNEGRGRREEDAGGFVDGAHGYGGWNVRMRRANGGAQFRFQLNCAIS